ncbi:3-[(3aS,4S,7aS)-7a-methyl-1,5-dioxo-octahydro-1H-inden-4-yl]propanoyl:CoA ligase-like [Littorina saxatilis]|uniref:Uncharacterized protein n=1 Tax=Littorina saxatilis TaxID=31220 RepID=A0AAN9B799_9CAEN
MSAKETDPPHIQTVAARLIHWATLQPDREAYIFLSPRIGRSTLTRRNAKDMAFTFAERLTSLGLRHGDVVCNTLQNSPERVVTDLGIMTSGCVMVDKRAFLRDVSDMVHVLTKSEARLVIVDPGEKNENEFPSAWEAIRSQCSVIGVVDTATYSVTVTWPDVTSLQRVMFCPRGDSGTEFEFLNTLKTSQRPEASPKENGTLTEKKTLVLPSDLAALFPTSGSTGLSKLSAFTQASVLDIADNWQHLFKLQDDDVIFQDRPVGWVAAFHHSYLASGTPRVMTDGRTQVPESCPDSVWSFIAQEGVTFAHLTPQTVSKLLSRPDLIGKHNVTLRGLLMTGQPIKKHMAQTIGTLTRRMYNSYGATEIAYLTAGRFEKESDFDDFLVGFPHPRAQIRVVDDNLQPVGPGVTGEVLLRCQGQFEGYRGDEEKTKKTLLPGGWVRTDDLGLVDDRGRLFMFGRQSDAIMRGVVIIYPYAIEKSLARIPGVQDVMVVAVPDPELFHEICACVVVSPGSGVTAESLKKSCSEMNAQWHFDLPTVKYFLLFDAFPTTGTGKASRKLLQAEACTTLGLQP